MTHVRKTGGPKVVYDGAEEGVCEVVGSSKIQLKRATTTTGQENMDGLAPVWETRGNCF